MHRDLNTTVIMSEHTLENVYDIADSVLILDGGKLLIKDDKSAAASFIKNSQSRLIKALPAKLRADGISGEKEEFYFGEAALCAKNLYYAYSKGQDILQGLDIKLYKNKINAVVGPNASGKSTLLKVLCGVNKAYRGKIKTDLKASMLPQNVFDLFTRETCGEEVQFGEITRLLGIDDIKDFHPYDISGGQAQRLALAKVLAQNADLILLDEPTKGFDCILKAQLGELLKKLCSDGKTVVIVTHDLEFAGDYADVCSFLSRGRIVATKQTEEFFKNLNFYTTPLARLTEGRQI